MCDLALDERSVRPIGRDPCGIDLFGSGGLEDRLVFVDRHRTTRS
jgi:hypothetical protein